MLHSDLITEYPCDGELVRVEERCTDYLTVLRCRRCTTEISFTPDSSWVHIVLRGDEVEAVGLQPMIRAHCSRSTAFRALALLSYFDLPSPQYNSPMRNRRTRPQKIAVCAVTATVLATLCALFRSEIRQFLHLERPTEIVKQSVPALQNVEPAKHDVPQNKTTQKTTTRITGDSNVAGNNVTGNVLGNNNQTARTAIAPNGISISGGNVVNPTVNNYAGPPSRRLSDEQKSNIVSCLKSNPGAFTVEAVATAEAQHYASDFSEVLTAAGWKNEQPTPVATIEIMGGSWTGIRINFHGTWDDRLKRAR